jgi:hypothetical protein
MEVKASSSNGTYLRGELPIVIGTTREPFLPSDDISNTLFEMNLPFPSSSSSSSSWTSQSPIRTNSRAFSFDTLYRTDSTDQIATTENEGSSSSWLSHKNRPPRYSMLSLHSSSVETCKLRYKCTALRFGVEAI